MGRVPFCSLNQVDKHTYSAIISLSSRKRKFMGTKDMPPPTYLPRDTKFWNSVRYPTYFRYVNHDDYVKDFEIYIHYMLDVIANTNLDGRLKACVVMCCAIVDFGERFLSEEPKFANTVIMKVKELKDIEQSGRKWNAFLNYFPLLKDRGL